MPDKFHCLRWRVRNSDQNWLFTERECSLVWSVRCDTAMGNADTKLVFRKAVVQLTSKTQVSYTVGGTAVYVLWSANLACVDLFHRPSALRTTIFGISSGRKMWPMCRTSLRLCRPPRYGCSERTCRPIWLHYVTKQSRNLSKPSRTVVAHSKTRT